MNTVLTCRDVPASCLLAVAGAPADMIGEIVYVMDGPLRRSQDAKT